MEFIYVIMCIMLMRFYEVNCIEHKKENPTRWFPQKPPSPPGQDIKPELVQEQKSGL